MDEKEIDEQIAALKAQSDQLTSALEEMADSLGSFYRELRKGGIAPAHAFVLVRDWFLHLIHMGKDQ